MFDIRFESAVRIVGRNSESDGLITVGDHTEAFTASHAVLDRSGYEQQWREAADRLIAGRPARFLVDLADGGHEYRGECWTAWPEGDVAVVQNQLLVGDGSVDPDDPYASLPPLAERITEEGHRISTWRMKLADVAAWRQRWG